MTSTPRPKKFKNTSPTGLGIAKNGKRQYPFIFQPDKAGAFVGEDDKNGYGQFRPKVGDYVATCIPSGILSAGTVGILVADEVPERLQTFHDGAQVIQYLDGRREPGWRYGIGYLTREQALEVRQFYIDDGRPERIKAKIF